MAFPFAYDVLKQTAWQTLQVKPIPNCTRDQRGQQRCRAFNDDVPIAEVIYRLMIY